MKYYSNFSHNHYSNLRPKKNKKRHSSPPPRQDQVNYKFRFYMIIAIIITATIGYIYLQIEYNQDSIFSKIYTNFQGSKIMSGTSIFRKKKSSSKKTTTFSFKKRSHISDKSSVRKNNDKNIGNITKDIYIYLALSDQQNNIKIVPKKQKVSFDEGKIITAALNELISYKPENQSLINSFNPQVELIEAYFENNVLMLNFNKNFEYNKYGYLGLYVQIQQILWTVFAIKEDINIAFLINGKRQHVLGGEGMQLKIFYTPADKEKIVNQRKLSS